MGSRGGSEQKYYLDSLLSFLTTNEKLFCFLHLFLLVDLEWQIATKVV